jgi:hypothetical protein
MKDKKMEAIVALNVLNIVLSTALNHYERVWKRRKMMKWLKGEMTMEELLWLKRQVWFQRAFKKVKVEPDKKNN